MQAIKALIQTGFQRCGFEVRRTMSGTRFLTTRKSPHRLPATRTTNDEDHILWALLNQSTGFFVEVGALDGIGGSNSRLFEKRGWKCLLVEPDPQMAAECAKNRPLAQTFSAAAVAPSQIGRVTFQVIEHNRAMSGLSFDEAGKQHFQKHGVVFVPTPIQVEGRTLDSILEESKFPRVDAITIDVEGHEADVLQGFTLSRWQPRLVMLERIATDVDPFISQLMKSNGYERVLTVPLGAQADCNDFWFKRPGGL